MSDKIFQTSTALPAPRVSVVLPLFNAGEHFRACIDSLVAQAQTDFEVIVVADAPSDGSLKLARDYALQDERIRVIENQTNMHIGMSRNIGLQAVRAPFVVFVDHDDICNPLMLSCLLEKQVESDADVVFGLVDTTVVGDPTNGMLFPTIDSSEYSGYDMSSAESRRLFALHDILSAGGSAAAESLFTPILGNLYRAELARQLQFVPTPRLSAEDLIYNVMFLHAANRVDWVNEVVYTHVNHSTNEGNRDYYKGVESRGRAMQFLLDEVKSWDDADYFMPSLRKGLGRQAVNLLLSSAKMSFSQMLQVRRELKALAWLKETDFDDGRKRNLPKNVLHKLCAMTLQ